MQVQILTGPPLNKENNMKWKLFLDDERYPPKETEGFRIDNSWVISRNVDDAIWYVTNYGMPFFISFDHDLGAFKQTGMDFAKWLVNYILYNNVSLDDFDFFVHSQNPCGAENIRSLMSQLKQKIEEGYFE